MLWEVEEFGENYAVAAGGALRILLLRGMHSEYCYDEPGSALVRVYRRMGTLRRALPALRSRDFFFFNTQSRPADGLIVFQRREAASGGQPEQIAHIFDRGPAPRLDVPPQLQQLVLTRLVSGRDSRVYGGRERLHRLLVRDWSLG
jgi:hypothetical protein